MRVPRELIGCHQADSPHDALNISIEASLVVNRVIGKGVFCQSLVPDHAIGPYETPLHAWVEV